MRRINDKPDAHNARLVKDLRLEFVPMIPRTPTKFYLLRRRAKRRGIRGKMPVVLLGGAA